MDNISFEIMSGNRLVAVWNNECLDVINAQLLPMYLRCNDNALLWLKSRATDKRRPNIRLLKKALRLAERDDISTVVHVNGATTTDNYWVRPIGSDLTYDDVKFDNDFFSNLALKGTYDSFNKAAMASIAKHRNSLISVVLRNAGSFVTASGGCIRELLTMNSFQSFLSMNSAKL